jgi:outer membrane autotransporter protein
LLPIAWPQSISNQKNKTALAIDTIATVLVTIVKVLILMLVYASRFRLSRVSVRSGTWRPSFNDWHCQWMGADMACDPRRMLSIRPRRGTASRARGCKSVPSRLLATIALVAASSVSSHAQTNWTGQFSSNWFLAGNWDAGFPRQTTDANIDTVTPNPTVISSSGALAQNLAVGQSGTGMLTIQTGGTLADSFAAVGNHPGGLGTVTVTGVGSSWSTAGSVVVGGQGTGILTIQDGGTVSSGGGSVGLSAGSTGTVTVTGPGSSWTNGTSGGLNIGSFGTGTLTIANGGQVINFNPNIAANIGNGAGSLGTVTVTGAGSLWSNRFGLNIGNSGTGTLTIADGGVVTGLAPVVIAANSGAIGTLNIGAGAGNPPVAPGTLNTPTVAFGAGTGTINFNHTSADYVFAPAIVDDGTVNVLAGTTTLTGANTYSGATNVDAGTLRAGALNTFSPNSAVTVGGGTLDLNGFNQTLSSLTNAGLVSMGTGTAPGTTLTTTGYIGTGGTIAMNTFLGGDGSPSDKLVVNGGSATGNSLLHITNAGGPGAETVANGIAVVQAINGGTTASGTFALAGEVRGGAFDYDLFRGGLGGSNPNDWFLRSTFIVGPPEPIVPPEPPILPPEPPQQVLPPGIYPIIGPEIATYGVVQPIARQLGMTTLGTLHDRVGDTSLNGNIGAPCPPDGDTRDTIVSKAPVKPTPDCLYASWWGRVLGQQINNRYTAFADPRASGQLLGFQSGIDLWRGEWLPGHRDAAGIYFAYANADVDVNGLVTNEAVTGYVLRKTGSLNLDAWSGGAYWTHYGPSNWYLDAVVQVTHYEGAASTQFTSLATTGFGFVSSLEAGFPIPLPLFGPGFVLEPQAQIVWQQVSFDDANDGLGEVALGTTSGASGRVGLRGRWTIVSDSGQVWQPYVRANLWRDWGAQATTIFSGADLVPLLEQATRLQLGGGVSVRVKANVSLYANADYQFAVGDTDGGRRDGFRGAAGVRYTW